VPASVSPSAVTKVSEIRWRRLDVAAPVAATPRDPGRRGTAHPSRASADAHLPAMRERIGRRADRDHGALPRTGAGNVENGAHRYLATFVTATAKPTRHDLGRGHRRRPKPHARSRSPRFPRGSAVTDRYLYRTIAAGHLSQTGGGRQQHRDDTDNCGCLPRGAGAEQNTTAIPSSSPGSARRAVLETFTHRAFITQTWDLQMDGFPWASNAPESRSRSRPARRSRSITYVDNRRP